MGHGTFVRFWVHNALVRLDDDKMSKSLGNVVTVGEALRRFSADALRLFFLSSHYRSPLTYSEEAVAAQERAVERLRNALATSPVDSGDRTADPEPFRERFHGAMDDDLNTPRAIAALFDLGHEINRAREDGKDVTVAQVALRELSEVLGLLLSTSERTSDMNTEALSDLLVELRAALSAATQPDLADRIQAQLSNAEGGEEDVGALLDLLVDTRAKLRAAKRYDLADRVRDGLMEIGVVLEDTLHGTEWKRRLG